MQENRLLAVVETLPPELQAKVYEYALSLRETPLPNEQSSGADIVGGADYVFERAADLRSRHWADDSGDGDAFLAFLKEERAQSFRDDIERGDVGER